MNTNHHFPNRNRNGSGRFTGNLHRIVFWVIIGLILAVLFAVVFGIAVKFLWGATLSPIFGIPQISYWQAVGIVILARLVFGGFGYRSHSKSKERFWPDGKTNESSPFFRKMHNRFHGWSDEKDETDSKPIVPESNQKHYHDFWEKEGKKAFQDYLAKVEKGNGSDDS